MAVTLPAQAPSQIQSPVYPPIANHGVVGDMRTVALVTDNGAIDWYCPSAFDSPSVFGAILDSEHGGHYRIAPARECATKQLYLPDTNVLITRFLSPDGVGEVQDFMPVGGEQRLIRRVVCVRGHMRFVVECEPRFNYGRDRHATAISSEGACFRSPSLTLTLGTSVCLRQTATGVSAEFELDPGGSAAFVLAETGEVPQRVSEAAASQRGGSGRPAR
jgi:GH15 family glucan-1,4-alpha-glucosidase